MHLQPDVYLGRARGLEGDSHYFFSTANSRKRLIDMCSPNYQKVAKLALTGISTLFFAVVVSAVIAQPSLQLVFDSLGPTVEQLRSDNGRNIHFIDDGRARLPLYSPAASVRPCA
jgi:hypothetical protein